MKKFIIEFEGESGDSHFKYKTPKIEVEADCVAFQGNFVIFAKAKSSEKERDKVIVAYNSAGIKKVYNPELHKSD